LDIFRQIEDFLGEAIVSKQSVGGGCIADAKTITTTSGKRWFIKTQLVNETMFSKEANGLIELGNAQCIRVPKVVLSDARFLLLEYIDQGIKTSNFFTDFGYSLAKMHQHTGAEYGFYEDNYIGASPQYNQAQGGEKHDWAEFYFQKRLLPQLQMAEKNGEATTELRQGISKLESKIGQILSGSNEPPSLLHGDLWGGNYLCDHQERAVLIDPAVYYGHRETDLAMTKMFGGFSAEFYGSYQQAFPLADGWEYREKVYLLYHYLNHLNLFGRGYYETCIRLIDFYL